MFHPCSKDIDEHVDELLECASDIPDIFREGVLYDEGN
jgi:hypothetical protein